MSLAHLHVISVKPTNGNVPLMASITILCRPTSKYLGINKIEMQEVEQEAVVRDRIMIVNPMFEAVPIMMKSILSR